MSIKTITSAHQRTVIDAAANTALERGRRAAGSDVALPVMLAGALVDQVDRQARVFDPKIGPSERLELQAEAAHALVLALDALAAPHPAELHQAAHQAASNLGAAFAISRNEDQIAARLVSLGRQHYQIDPARLTADLDRLKEAAKQIAGPMAHDVTFVRYAQGHQVDDPAFTLPGSVISALGDERLRAEMLQRGERDFEQALSGLVVALAAANAAHAPDPAAGRPAPLSGPARPASVEPSSSLSTETLKAIAHAGYELAMVRDTLREGGTPNWSRYPVARAMLATTPEVSTLIATLHGLCTAAEQLTGKSMAELVAPPGVRAQDFSPANLAAALRWAMKELGSEKSRPGFDTRVSALAQSAVVPGALKLEDEARYLKAEEEFVFALQAQKRESGFYLEKGSSPEGTLRALQRLVERLENPQSVA